MRDRFGKVKCIKEFCGRHQRLATQMVACDREGARRPSRQSTASRVAGPTLFVSCVPVGVRAHADPAVHDRNSRGLAQEAVSLHHGFRGCRAARDRPASADITPLRLYLEKSGVEFPERDTGPKEMGRRLEAVVAEIVSERRPDWELESPNTFYFDDDEGLGATPDRIIHNDPQGLGILQIKTTRPDTFERAWDKGRNVPFFIVVQTQVEMWAVWEPCSR